MFQDKKIIGMVLVAVTLGACSTASVRVMPGENGLNRVVVRDRQKHSAEEEAVDAANEYCEKRKKSAIFMKDKTQYKGDMDESTRNTIQHASQAAAVLGAGSLGMVGSSMTSGKDYQAEVRFKCE